VDEDALTSTNRVDNPKYLVWKKFQPAAKANYVFELLHEYKPGTDQCAKSRISRMTFSLMSIDAERAVVTDERFERALRELGYAEGRNLSLLA